MRAWEFITRRSMVGGGHEPTNAEREKATVRSIPPQQIGRASGKQAGKAAEHAGRKHDQPRRR
jgi:hypothetical protein